MIAGLICVGRAYGRCSIDGVVVVCGLHDDVETLLGLVVFVMSILTVKTLKTNGYRLLAAARVGQRDCQASVHPPLAHHSHLVVCVQCEDSDLGFCWLFARMVIVASRYIAGHSVDGVLQRLSCEYCQAKRRLYKTRALWVLRSSLLPKAHNVKLKRTMR